MAKTNESNNATSPTLLNRVDSAKFGFEEVSNVIAADNTQDSREITATNPFNMTKEEE